MQYSITTRDILYEINQRLDAYLSYFKETRAYVPAVKQFYALVEKNEYPLSGMVVIGTKDNLPHPVLKIGDIVLTRKGESINNIDDYKNAKEKTGEDVLTFLRLDNNGRLGFYKETIPPTEVMTGFLDLKEEN